MASGIKGSCNRPKQSKRLASATHKKFRNESPVALAKYREKMAKRAARKLKKRR